MKYNLQKYLPYIIPYIDLGTELNRLYYTFFYNLLTGMYEADLIEHNLILLFKHKHVKINTIDYNKLGELLEVIINKEAPQVINTLLSINPKIIWNCFDGNKVDAMNYFIKQFCPDVIDYIIETELISDETLLYIFDENIDDPSFEDCLAPIFLQNEYVRNMVDYE